MKRKLAWSSSDEEPLDEARNSVGSSSSRLERFNRLERIPDPPERPTLAQPFTRDLKKNGLRASYRVRMCNR